MSVVQVKGQLIKSWTIPKVESVSFEGREASYKYDQNGQIVSPLTALVNDLMAHKVDPGDLGSTGQEPTKQLG